MLHIGIQSFSSCITLESVDLRSTCINKIGAGSFEGCTNLSTVHLPTTTKSLGVSCFCGCERIAHLDLQATSIETIEEFAFQHCVNLKAISLPKTVRYIGYGCFGSCTELECLNFQETSIEKVGMGAFRNCTSLPTIVGFSSHHQEGLQENMDDDEILRYHSYMKLPVTLVEVGENAFSNCPKLKHSIDNARIHYVCDINHGGRRFLQRHHRHENDDDGNANESAVGKVYYSSLWPLILYRAMNNMKLPKQRICCPHGEYPSSYTRADPLQRRASVAFYLLIHGVTADLQS